MDILSYFANVDWVEIWQATNDTMVMLFISLAFIILLGLPLGVVLFLFSPRQMFEHKKIYAVLATIVNIVRSVPFIILLIVMIPITVLITCTSHAWSRRPCVKWIAASSRPPNRWAPPPARSSSRQCSLKPCRASSPLSP